MSSTPFSIALQAARRKAGFAFAREFAKVVDIQENRYTRYERGDSEPNLALLCRICTELGTTPNDLLGFVERREAPGHGFSDDETGAQSASSLFRNGPIARSDPRPDPTLTPADAAVWRFCEVYLSMDGHPTGTNGDKRKARKAAEAPIEKVARMYLQLRANPLSAFATLLTSDAYATLPPAKKGMLEPIVAAVIKDMLGRAERPSALAMADS